MTGYNLMTGKERLQFTLNHREPDRIPFDLNGTETSGISIIALKNWLGFNGLKNDDLKSFSLVTQLGLVEEEVLQRFHVHTRCLRTSPPSSYKIEIHEDNKHKYFYDEWGIKWQMPLQGGHYFDIGSSPLAGVNSIREIENYPWPDPYDPSRYEYLRKEALNLESVSQAGIVLERHTGGIFETSWWMRGFENFLMDLAANPKLANAIMEKVLEHKMVYWEKALEKTKDYILVAAEADDIASQNGLIISIDMYRNFLKPLHKKLFPLIKAKAPELKIFFHSCGAVLELIPDLIEIGVEILNPIQVSASGMDTRKLKKEFGRDLVFWGGGVDTQKVLPKGTPQQVKDEVRRRIDDLAPGGGFVFAAVHCIQSDVPPENIQAMWEALQEYGKY